MKKFFIPVFFCFILFTSKTQVVTIYKPEYKQLSDFKEDTLSYLLNNFIDSKQMFIGKSLDSLLTRLEIKPLTYAISVIGSRKDFVSDYLYLNLEPRGVSSKKIDSYVIPNKIIVEWDRNIPLDSLEQLYRNPNRKWTSREASFFGKYTVKNILMVNADPRRDMREDDAIPNY